MMMDTETKAAYLKDMQERYMQAVNDVIDVIKKDVNVIAIVVQGSLTNDVVWEKSDIDATVIVRDQKIEVSDFCIDQDDIAFNIDIMERSKFVRMLERSSGASFGHSFYAKAQMMYTTDDSLKQMLEDSRAIGEKDAERSALFLACEVVCLMEKCQKWLYIKEDYTYCKYYILKAAEQIAALEICLVKESPSREAIQRAHQLNPELMERFYYRPIKEDLGKDELEELINAIDEYLMKHIEVISREVLNFLDDGELKTLHMITRHLGSAGHILVHILDYFRDKGLIEKASQTVRLTPKSRPNLEEVAYIVIKDGFGMM